MVPPSFDTGTQKCGTVRKAQATDERGSRPRCRVDGPARVKMSQEALPAQPPHPREARVGAGQAAGPTPRSPFL